MQKVDEKKVKEAIERMCKMRDAYNATLRSLPQKTRERSDYNNYVDAFLVAIEALEKQLPEKPIFEGDGFDELGDIVFDEWLCPLCNARYEVDYQEYDYCPSCGQKLDWSEK